MNSDDAILYLDFDPNLLISLLEKLSLDNIPSDVTETLLSVENNIANVNETDIFGAGLDNSFVSTPVLNVPDEPECPETSALEEEKISFLTSIGLTAESSVNRKPAKIKGIVNPYNEEQISLDLWNNLAYEAKNSKKETPILSESSSEYSQTRNKLLGKTTNVSLNEATGNIEQNPPFLSSEYCFKDVFYKRANVFDIQLSDFDSSRPDASKLPFLFTDEEASNDSCIQSSLGSTLAGGPVSSEQAASTTNGQFSNPDSGYDSSCSNAVSPCALVNDAYPCSLDDSYEDASDDELTTIVATIVAVEKSLQVIEATECSSKVPVLEGSKNAEDHKEDILNFLKEPMSKEVSSRRPFFQKNKNSPTLKPVSDNALEKATVVPVLSKRDKRSPKKKHRKESICLDSAIRDYFGHSLIFTKGKHCLEREKILKQIQEDVGQVQKKVKIVQLIDKRLKRSSASGDRENKRRRIQHKDSF